MAFQGSTLVQNQPQIGWITNDAAVKQKTLTEPIKKNRRKKKKKRHNSDDLTCIPSPNNSLNDSFTQARENVVNGLKGLYDMNTINAALCSLEGQYGKRCVITLDLLIDAAFKLEDEKFSGDYDSEQLDSTGLNIERDDNCRTGKLQVDAVDDHVDSEESEIESELDEQDRMTLALSEVKDRYQKLIDKITITCHICNENEANILLLPCGHLVSCENCLMDVRRCPVPRCKKVVRGTKEVFFA